MLREEINSFDVLGYCWILTKTPSLRDLMAANIHELVDDASADDMFLTSIYQDLAKKNERPSPEKVLGELAKPHDKLLKHMFPRLHNIRTEIAGDRIAKRRNLIRLLYLGDPPGSYTQSDIVRTLDDTPDASTLQLRRMLEDGSLATFLDRVSDAVEEISEDQSNQLWLGLSEVLVRPHDWMMGPEPARSLADDAQQLLFNLGLRSARGAARARNLVDRLIWNDDLIIVPGFLRRHMFEHGLVRDTPSREGRTVLDKSETSTLLEREVPRYLAGITSGHILKRITDVEAIFVLINGGYWSQELRENLTEQLLSGPRAVETFAGLLIPPGYIIDHKTLNELVDAERLLRAVERHQESGDFADEEWLQNSVKRLRLTLEGKDPHFS
jgi:hypothetical protein